MISIFISLHMGMTTVLLLVARESEISLAETRYQGNPGSEKSLANTQCPKSYSVLRPFREMVSTIARTSYLRARFVPKPSSRWILPCSIFFFFTYAFAGFLTSLAYFFSPSLCAEPGDVHSICLLYCCRNSFPWRFIVFFVHVLITTVFFTSYMLWVVLVTFHLMCRTGGRVDRVRHIPTEVGIYRTYPWWMTVTCVSWVCGLGALVM